MKSTLHQLGTDLKIYRILLPDGRMGVGPSVQETLTIATSAKEADHILNNDKLKWSPYQVRIPPLKGRLAPVGNANRTYEECTVTHRNGDVAFTVYRATNYNALKGIGLDKHGQVKQAKSKKDARPAKSGKRDRK